MTQQKSNVTSFKKGRKKTGGRKAGVPNSTTRALGEALILAAETVGRDGAGKDGLVGYLTRIANTNIPVFCSLLARAMPLQTQTEAQKIEQENKRRPEIYSTVEELQAALRRRGLPDDISMFEDFMKRGVLPYEKKIGQEIEIEETERKELHN